MKGYQTVGDLIDEILDLKKKIRRDERKHLEGTLSLLKMFQPLLSETCRYPIGKHIRAIEVELETQ